MIILINMIKLIITKSDSSGNQFQASNQANQVNQVLFQHNNMINFITTNLDRSGNQFNHAQNPIIKLIRFVFNIIKLTDQSFNAKQIAIWQHHQ